MEESGGVALVRQLAGYAADVVERVAGDKEGFDKHGYAGEDGGHTVDALAAVGVGMAEGEAVGDERVEEGGIAGVVVVCTEVFLTEALENDDDDVW